MSNQNTVSTAPAHLSLEFRTRDGAPERAITFEILGGSTDPNAVLEIYANLTSNPVGFPLLSQAAIHQRFDDGHNVKATVGSPDSVNFDRFRSEQHFVNSKFYTMIAIQRDANNVIIGHSDLRTFFMSSKGQGIRGFARKYMPDWPNPNRVIVGGHNWKQAPAWFIDTDGNAYLSTSNGERGARVPFDALSPEYMIYANKQGFMLPDGQKGVGRYINRFFMVDNDSTDKDGNVVAPGRDAAFMAGDRNPLNISGIVTTKVDINSLL